MPAARPAARRAECRLCSDLESAAMAVVNACCSRMLAAKRREATLLGPMRHAGQLQATCSATGLYRMVFSRGAT